jgi:hypothetical protein
LCSFYGIGKRKRLFRRAQSEWFLSNETEMILFDGMGWLSEASRDLKNDLGRVDKRDSHRVLTVIQAGICDGDQLGTRPDVGRRVGVL